MKVWVEIPYYIVMICINHCVQEKCCSIVLSIYVFTHKNSVLLPAVTTAMRGGIAVCGAYGHRNLTALSTSCGGWSKKTLPIVPDIAKNPTSAVHDGVLPNELEGNVLQSPLVRRD